MNSQGKIIIYGILITMFLGIILGSLYFHLGGFEEVKVYKLEPINRTVAGKNFYTHYRDETPRDFGVICKQMLDSGEVSGELVVINYKNDTIHRDYIHQFIGIELSEDLSEIPSDFDIKELESKERYAVFLSMHVIVQPRPHVIESMLEQRAQSDNQQLEDFFFEIRYPDNSLSVEGWVK